MPSYPWHASATFWIEKVRHLHQILYSMYDHGGFELVCSQWTPKAKRECVAELDLLIDVVSAWKNQLDDPCDSTQPIDPIPDVVLASGRITHLRIASNPALPEPLSVGPRLSGSS